MAQQMVLPDDERGQKVGALRALSLGILAAAAVGFIMVVIIWLLQRSYNLGAISMLVGVVGATSLLAYWLAGAGKVRTSGYIFIVGLMLEFAVITLMIGGATGPVGIIYILPIMMSGIVLGINYGFLIATLAAALYFLMIPLGQSGMIPQIIAPVEKGALVPLFLGIWIIVFYLCAFLSWFAARSLGRALQETRRYAGDLQTANEKLQASEEEIRASNEELEAANEELRATEEELRAGSEELAAANDELKAVQEQLVRSEKLAAIGQLAGGVGHELRNPLGAIKNAVYYIRGKINNGELTRKEPRVMEFLDIVDDEINSSNKIINDLLNFSRVGKPAVSPARIERVIDDAIAHTSIPEGIELTREIDGSLPEVEIDTDQVRQVLVNIITNAVQAMPHGGRLTIAAGTVAESLRVAISDTGIGIPGDAINKVFDPLYTMKAKGIGLGLAVCKSIVDRHGGHIGVESVVGRGTTFTVKLPLRTG